MGPVVREVASGGDERVAGARFIVGSPFVNRDFDERALMLVAIPCLASAAEGCQPTSPELG